MNSSNHPESMDVADDSRAVTVSSAEEVATSTFDASAARRRFSWQRFGGNFLLLSIAAHVFLLAVAAYFVVSTIQSRKLTFQSGPKGPSAPQRDREHSVKMKKQSTMSAPPQARRVTSTSRVAKVSLPDMPAMPGMSAALSPSLLSGMGAGSIGSGMGLGGGGGNGSGAINFFGARGGGGGLQGIFYDFKQDRARQPTNMDSASGYIGLVSQFVRGGFNEAVFSNYYRGEKPLYAAQIYIPRMPADEGPKAFGLENLVRPKMWVVLYKGQVLAPQSGTFSFVGYGDDVLIVRFNGKVVLDGSIRPYVPGMPNAKYSYEYMARVGIMYKHRGHRVGEKFSVLANSSYSIEVLIGEQPGAEFQANLLIEKEGGEYRKDGAGNPILPIFRTSDAKLPAPARDKGPPFEADGPVWRIDAAGRPRSLFDQRR